MEHVMGYLLMQIDSVPPWATVANRYPHLVNKVSFSAPHNASRTHFSLEMFTDTPTCYSVLGPKLETPGQKVSPFVTLGLTT
jgi:hypothetical protein